MMNNLRSKSRTCSGILMLSLIILASACEEAHTPKPRGYYRIALPEKEYIRFDSLCPFSFEYPVYGIPEQDEHANAEPCWMNIQFPGLNASLHMSYKPVRNNLRSFLEDSRTLAMKHTQRANDIREIPVIMDSSKVYGLIYDIRGNAASSLQFYLTDSVHHFMRASLYFNVAPNVDSVAPVLDFLRADLENMIRTFRWKETSIPQPEE